MEVPIMPNGEPLMMPFDNWDEWEKTYCGPGEGIGDWIVPEKYPGGTNITACCFVHDIGGQLANTPEEEAYNDRMFLKNIIEAIFYHHPLDVIGSKEHVDLLWAITYYAAVDKRTTSNDGWQMVRRLEQNYEMPKVWEVGKGW